MADDITELMKVRAAFEELRAARWWVDYGSASSDHEALRECVRHLRSDCTTPEMGARVLALCDAIERLQADLSRVWKLADARGLQAQALQAERDRLREALERIERSNDRLSHGNGVVLSYGLDWARAVARRALAGD